MNNFWDFLETAKSWVKEHKYPVLASVTSSACIYYAYSHFFKKKDSLELIKIPKPEIPKKFEEVSTTPRIVVESKKHKTGLKLYQSSFIQFEYPSNMELVEEESSITLKHEENFIIMSHESADKRNLTEIIDDYSKSLEEDLEFKKGKLFNIKGRYSEHGEKNFFITLIWDQAFIIYSTYSLSFIETEVLNNLVFFDRLKEKLIYQGKSGIKIQLPSSSFKYVPDTNAILLVERNYGEDIEQFKIEEKKFQEKGYLEDHRKDMNGKLYYYGEGGKHYRFFAFTYNSKPYIITTVSPFIHNFIKESIDSLTFGKSEKDIFTFRNTEEKFSIQAPICHYNKLKSSWQFVQKNLETLIYKESGDIKGMIDDELEGNELISKSETKIYDLDAIQMEYKVKEEYIFSTWIPVKQNVFVITSFLETKNMVPLCKEIHNSFKKE